MCGIAGLLTLGRERPQRSQLERMSAALAHRGPDDAGVHLDGPVALAQRRLSILDLQGGHQPMHLAEAGLSISFNGEIFNYVELREELQRRGRRFRTRSDTEVVLQLYAEWGADCLSMMNGQWALAIWDARRRSLFLARDRVGIRPLHYTCQGGVFAFASEIKALLCLPWVAREVDPQALAETFVFWHALPPRTFFRGVVQLPPGCTLTVSPDRPEPVIRRYWRLDYATDWPPRAAGEAAEELDALLSDAVRLRLRSDVPVGAYLSGGLDSSVTAGLVRSTSNTELRSFSFAFSDPEFDEYPFQREVARHLGTRHDVVRCAQNEICEVFPSVVRHTEAPLVRAAPAPLFLLSRRVNRGRFKVVLTGEGADEVLGGYDIFKEAKVRHFWARMPASRLRPLLLRRLYPYMSQLQSQPLEYLQAYFRAGPDELQSPLFSHLPRWELGRRNQIFLADRIRSRLRDHDPLERLRAALPARFSRWDYFSRAQFLETTYLLPGYILSAQGDRMAMAHAVEGRFPFLDHRVVEFGARLSPRLKMLGLNEKYLLKRAMARVVPPSVVRRPKQPYRAPDAASFFTKDGWPAAEYVSEMFTEQTLSRAGLFNPRAAQRLFAKAKAGRALSTKDNMAFVGILSAQLLWTSFACA